MVLYYGLLALETANNTVAAANASSASSFSTKTTTTAPGLESHRTRLSHKQKSLSNSTGKMPLPSSSNSWIYTEDLRKRFEERYADYRYVFVPVYIDRKSKRQSHSTTAIPRPAKVECEHSWMYSRSLRDHLYYSTSKMFVPLRGNKSSSACCVTNHGFMRDELPLKKDLRTRLFKRSASTRDKSSTTLSLSSLRLSPHTSSTSSVTVPANTLVRHRTSDVVEEEDDEAIDGENHSVPLIKHEYVSLRETERERHGGGEEVEQTHCRKSSQTLSFLTHPSDNGRKNQYFLSKHFYHDSCLVPRWKA